MTTEKFFAASAYGFRVRSYIKDTAEQFFGSTARRDHSVYVYHDRADPVAGCDSMSFGHHADKKVFAQLLRCPPRVEKSIEDCDALEQSRPVTPRGIRPRRTRKFLPSFFGAHPVWKKVLKTATPSSSLVQLPRVGYGRGGQESFCPAFFKKLVLGGYLWLNKRMQWNFLRH